MRERTQPITVVESRSVSNPSLERRKNVSVKFNEPHSELRRRGVGTVDKLSFEIDGSE